MTNIVLIGFMGSGKSTIAKLLSDALKMPYIDSDIYISDKEKRSIADIFTYKGEKHFRSLEFLFIESFSTKSNHIIATGGGMPIFNDVKKLGLCIYLQSDFETIKSRILNEEQNIRPLFQDIDKALRLYYERTPIYQKVSDYIVDSTKDIQVVVDNIIKIISHKRAYLC